MSSDCFSSSFLHLFFIIHPFSASTRRHSESIHLTCLIFCTSIIQIETLFRWCERTRKERWERREAKLYQHYCCAHEDIFLCNCDCLNWSMSPPSPVSGLMIHFAAFESSATIQASDVVIYNSKQSKPAQAGEVKQQRRHYSHFKREQTIRSKSRNYLVCS